MMSDMRSQKNISCRELRRGTPEEGLAAGESLIVQKRGGKVFELRRLDAGEHSLIEQLDGLLQEIPCAGTPIRTHLSRVIVEDRE
jgi:hypothetical protein